MGLSLAIELVFFNSCEKNMVNDKMDNIDYTKISRNEMLATLRGEDLESYRDREKIKKETDEQAKKYRNSDPAYWIDLKFNWDLKPESQRFALDGHSEDEFKKTYPEGLLLGYVDLKKFDDNLCHHSRRENNEIWKVGDEGKLAGVIAYVVAGHPLTPPIVGLTSNDKEVCLSGGNHRYTVAKFGGEAEIPIYIAKQDFEAINCIVTVRWCKPT
ncbi:hypothetical protein ACVTTK_02735 [Alcaligenes nematophilus]